MAAVFYWPHLDEVWSYIKSHGYNGYIIESPSSTTYEPGYCITIKNVPDNKVNLLQAWLFDCDQWMVGERDGPAYHISPLQMVTAHDPKTGKPLPPWESYKYVLKGINVFTKNYFQKKDEEYWNYLYKHVPDLKKQMDIEDAVATLKNILISIQTVTPNSGYVSQIEDLIKWVKNGTIDPKTAKARGEALKQQWLGWYKHYTSITASNSPDSKFETSPSPELNKASDTNGSMDKSPIYYKETSNSTSSDKTINIDLSSLLTSEQSKDKKKEWVYLLIMLVVTIVLVAILIKLKR